ncbi:TetR/AcrR family transcriptional regulator [Natrinema soli]|uniref:TetR/AcrR family transcriptional regulator n=1 Tax=Natrinema soli TaxID=1930624 RepID=A0ABD5SQJ7_9EURY|nr:TetR/AcrR family transcriptional regulator [Natrinema soli]
MSEGDTEAAHEAIMQATYRALCKHGYADLTMKAIAEETGKSKAILHYYYDTKQDLLVAFLEYLLESFHEKVQLRDDENPAAQLTTILEKLVFGPDDYKEFQTAMLELRSQAPYRDAYRAQLRANDEELTALLAGIIERGIEDGVFQDVDPDRTATYLLSTIDGARTRRIVLDDDDVLTTVNEELQDYLAERVLVDDQELVK